MEISQPTGKRASLCVCRSATCQWHRISAAPQNFEAVTFRVTQDKSFRCIATELPQQSETN